MEKDDAHHSLNNSNTDLSVKYQKLAAEYAKIRSQLNVLKRSFVDEQNRTTTLTDELNEREKTIRKYEQEIDSYSFRNQQLEKRVGVLQGDLTEKVKKSSKKDSGKNDKTEPSSKESVPLNELLTKIDENVQLTRQISQQEDTFRRQLSDLTNTYEEKLNHYRRLQAGLESEKSVLSRSLSDANAEISVAKRQISDLEEKVKIFGGSVPLQERIETREAQQPVKILEPSCDLISKLVKSQQETEYWKLEYELNKMKQRKILLKYEECRKHLKALGREDLLAELNEVTTPDSSVVTTLIGKMEIDSATDSELGTSYEKELIDYFTRRINELIHLLQLCDTKAITFYDECKGLQMHLALAAEDQNRLKESYNDLESKHSTLSEELQLVKNTYETQLQALTEHIANMNDKLASQTETINHLEFRIKNGSKKK